MSAPDPDAIIDAAEKITPPLGAREVMRRAVSHAWKSGYAQAKEEETPPNPDTMRLDWLETHGVEIGVSAKPEGSRFARWYRGQGYGDTIRAAIDAAMEQMEAEDSTKLALLFSNDWLRERIATDPDDDPQAGPAVE